MCLPKQHPYFRFIKAIFPTLLHPTTAQKVVRFAMDDAQMGRVSHGLCH